MKLVIPISVSGILTVVIFAFTLVTQEFVYALTFISSAAAPDRQRGRPDLPRPRRRLLLGLAHGGLPHRERSRSPILYNLFLDRFIAGFTVGAVK